MSANSVFDWLNFLPDSVTALAVAAGVWIANKQLSAWRTQAVETRNAEVAEQLMFAATNADAALRFIRNPWGRAPGEGDDPVGFVWRERLERMQEREADFDELRRAQIRAKAFLGNDRVNEAVASLFDVRQTVWAALGSLVQGHEDTATDEELRQFYMKLRWEVYGTYSDRDEVGKKQAKAIQEIEEELYPIIRMQPTGIKK